MKNGKNIVVVGSMNMDLVFDTDSTPEIGETLTGKKFMTTPGGKGANQACAAGKLGGDVSFVSARGKDGFGNELVTSLSENNVNVDNVYCVSEHTGTAGIIVEKSGDNRIIVIPGANGCVSPDHVLEKEELIKEAGFMLLQMEIPIESVICAIELGNKYGVTVILDPAPAQKLPENIYSKIDYLLPNEGELEKLLEDYDLSTTESKIEKLLGFGLKNLLITLGENGCRLVNKVDDKHFAGKKVKVVDTTAAGDTFAGAFACGLQQNMSVDDSINFAVNAGSLSVTKSGAQISMPTLDEVKKFANSN
ncbi:MAG: ribokinase [bacterium]|nr:ribokinase [bacterium]